MTTITSCNSQTDIETLHYNQTISKIIKSSNRIKKTIDLNYGLMSYETEDLKNLKVFEFYLKKYHDAWH